jgi:hypothetical protein
LKVKSGYTNTGMCEQLENNHRKYERIILQ